jgi:hypothetical protein
MTLTVDSQAMTPVMQRPRTSKSCPKTPVTWAAISVTQSRKLTTKAATLMPTIIPVTAAIPRQYRLHPVTQVRLAEALVIQIPKAV